MLPFILNPNPNFMGLQVCHSSPFFVSFYLLLVSSKHVLKMKIYSFKRLKRTNLTDDFKIVYDLFPFFAIHKVRDSDWSTVFVKSCVGDYFVCYFIGYLNREWADFNLELPFHQRSPCFSILTFFVNFLLFTLTTPYIATAFFIFP